MTIIVRDHGEREPVLEVKAGNFIEMRTFDGSVFSIVDAGDHITIERSPYSGDRPSLEIAPKAANVIELR